MRTLFIALLLFSANILLSQVPKSGQDPYARDILLLADWFEGEFDNDSQLWYQGKFDWTDREDEKHDQMHAIHIKVDLPDMGKHVFYVEEYMDNDITKIVRQRIVSFRSAPEEGGIKMDIYFLKGGEKYSAYGDLKMMNDIKKEDLFSIETCGVLFNRQGDQFHGSMGDKECQFGEGDKLRYSVHDMIISESKYWRVDRTFLVADDSFYKGHPTDVPHKMRKADIYKCDIKFHEKNSYTPSDKDKAYSNVMIHDQGGKALFDNPADGKKYAIQLREKEYPFYEDNADFFMMRFIEDGKMASNLIVTSAPNPEKISFNMGWVSAICYEH